MALHPSGYYAWRSNPQSRRKIEDQRLLGYIKQSWLESGAVYGYRKVHDDPCALGETCGHDRVYRLMRQAAIRSQTGYHRRPGHRGGQAAVVAPNRLQQQLNVGSRIGYGSQILRTFARMKAGCSWPWSLTYSPDR